MDTKPISSNTTNASVGNNASSTSSVGTSATTSSVGTGTKNVSTGGSYAPSGSSISASERLRDAPATSSFGAEKTDKMNRIKSSASDVVDNVRGKAGDVVDNVREKAGDVMTRVRDRAKGTYGDVVDFGQHLPESITRVRGTIDEHIHEHPRMDMAIVGGVSALLGAFFGRRIVRLAALGGLAFLATRLYPQIESVVASRSVER